MFGREYESVPNTSFISLYYFSFLVVVFFAAVVLRCCCSALTPFAVQGRARAIRAASIMFINFFILATCLLHQLRCVFYCSDVILRSSSSTSTLRYFDDTSVLASQSALVFGADICSVTCAAWFLPP